MIRKALSGANEGFCALMQELLPHWRLKNRTVSYLDAEDSLPAGTSV
jgi:hypothetical protein